ncbi:PilZ domain-containing protein [Bacillus sp. V59.32b]|nr:PilZ domain-containing protein [Bacillus sp. V59.32b]
MFFGFIPFVCEKRSWFVGGEEVYYLVLFEAFLIVLLLILYLRSEKKLKNLNLYHTTNNYPKKGSNETSIEYSIQKRAHRVLVPYIECTVKIVDFGNEKFESLRNKRFIGQVENISVTGVKFVSTYELPVKYEIIGEIYFTLGEKEFNLMGKIVRREDHLNGELRYGFEFFELKREMIADLSIILNNIEAGRRKQFEEIF